jgi:hypothetical protein
VSLRKHLSKPDGHDRGGYKVGGDKRWFGWAVTRVGAKPPQRPSREEVSDDSEGEEIREVRVRETKVKGKGVKKGESPRRRRRRIASPADSASYSWQPSLHSITEE